MSERRCRCGNGVADIRLTYDKNTRRGISRYTSGPMDMRCADKEAFAVMSRGVAWVKATRYREVVR